MNYTTHVGVPTAYVTRKKSRLKLYNGHNVFLNDGDNFEIELHNPKTESVLAKIKINGEYISTAGVVVRPGQRVFLERFLDSNNKFEFTTYDVKNTSKNRSAIALNGYVEIEFYDESQIVNYPNLSNGAYNPGWNTINTGSPYYGGLTYTTNSAGLHGTCGVGATFTSSSSFYSSTTPQGPNLRNTTSKLKIETGRVEKGESSNQNFTNSYENFSYAVSKQYQFKILPYSQKNKTSDDMRQYCTECGVKVKKNYKFCPSCGNKI